LIRAQGSLEEGHAKLNRGVLLKPQGMSPIK
jgi:hypothetical protein